MIRKLLALKDAIRRLRNTAPVDDDFPEMMYGVDSMLHQCEEKRSPEFEHPVPRIVCLCGSTRFYDVFQKANYDETMKGNIVLTVGFYQGVTPERGPRVEFHGEDIGCTPEQKVALDVLHKRKIDLCDEIFVLNVGDYVGNSTRSEISYAYKLRKEVRFLEPHKLRDYNAGYSV